MNNYKLEFTQDFQKQFKKLDKDAQKLIKKWIDKNLENVSNPFAKGKSLNGNLKNFWRYRIGIYRLIAEISCDKITIILVSIGKRDKVYKMFDNYLG